MKRHNLGFSLVELMVASIAGLIVVWAVASSVLTLGRQFSMIGSTAASQSDAQIALSIIDASARSAGAGFYNAGERICGAWNAFNGATVVADGDVFMPARIVGGGANAAPDRIIFTGGKGARSLVAVPVLDKVNGASLRVSNAGGWAEGDYAVLGVPGSSDPCRLVEISQAPTVQSGNCGDATSCQALLLNPGNSGQVSSLNPKASTFRTNPAFGYAVTAGVAAPAILSRVGSRADGFSQDAYAVLCNTLVRYNAFTTTTTPKCDPQPLQFDSGVDAIAPDVVMLRAQYGVSSEGSSDVVTQWVDPVKPADAALPDWSAPGSADVARIKALRLLVVVRAKEPDTTEVTADCKNGAGVVNTGPCSFDDAAAPVIDLSAVTTPGKVSWRNFRYRVHKAVIPLPAVIWSKS